MIDDYNTLAYDVPADKDAPALPSAGSSTMYFALFDIGQILRRRIAKVEELATRVEL